MRSHVRTDRGGGYYFHSGHRVSPFIEAHRHTFIFSGLINAFFHVKKLQYLVGNVVSNVIARNRKSVRRQTVQTAVSMLDLVSAGVFGACLSALICMITNGTACELPKLIRFENESLRPQIVRSKNWTKWKIASHQKDEGKREKFCRSGCRSKKLPSIDRNNRGRHVQTSLSNLETFDEKMVTKSANDVEEYRKEAKEDVPLPGSPDGAVNSWMYREKPEAASPKRVEPKYYRSSIAQSFTRLKDKLRSKRIDDESRMKSGLSYGSSKVRTKKRRFVLPKSLVIGRKPEDDAVTDRTGHTVDPIDEQLRLPSRYCYLEALRIKTNWS